VGGRQAYVAAREGLHPVSQRTAGEAGRTAVDRAVGLLAGRTRSRLSDAHRHVLRMAADQNRDVAEIAAGVIGLLDVPDPMPDRTPPDPATPPMESLLRAAGAAAVRRFDPWPGGVQRILDVVPGSAALMTPVRDPAGRLADLVCAAVSPAVVAADGRCGAQLIGVRMAENFPDTVAGDRWPIYARVLDSGEPAEVGPFASGDGVFSVRAQRLGDGLFVSWTRQDAGAQRLAEVERQLVEQRRTIAAEHDKAARLQEIILPIPDGPIVLPGLKVALRYLPAGQECFVGGDWYHAGELRDGSVLLAVGDVAGHGTPAATTMAQLRHALRALAVTTNDPGELLTHLNRLTCDLEQETPEMAATAVVARYDPSTRRLTWAQAGHPPPLLCRAGRTAPLARPAGPVLGVVDDAVYNCATVDLSAGDVLLLYTDGLVEHRRRGPDDGLDAVIGVLDEAVAASPSQPLGVLLERLRRTNPDDDTCILAARPGTGTTADLSGYLGRVR
jgi:serine phosphatase RsbU (regulator of sigma subunit)